MDVIRVNGAELSSMSLGQGPVVLMLHGLVIGNMASWFSPIALPLSAQRKVVLYDQRGHGDSSFASSGFDLDTQAQDLQTVMMHHGLDQEPVDLVGHSMGALIALRYALQNPDRVRRLVLIDAPMPACEHVAPSLQRVQSREGLMAWIDQELVVARGLSGRRRERLQKRLVALFFETTLREDVSAMASEPDEQLQKLKMPVLLVYGNRSPCLAASEHLSRVLPQARLVTLDCGHYVIEEAPVELRAVLDDFLSLPPDAMDSPAKSEPAAFVQPLGAV